MRSRELPTCLGLILAAIFITTITGIGSALAEPAYFLYPDIHADQIVFCADSDIWLTTTSGGTPQRLTTHPGTEYFPAFSPDGQWIAFTGRYDGNNDVYIIPVQGGEPRRLTWHPGRDEVVSWTPDGLAVIFRSNRSDPIGVNHLFTVDLAGNDPVELPLAWAARIDMDPDAGTWAFSRTSWQERATWKRYRGGANIEIWVGDPNQADYKNVTNFDGLDAFPMWHDGRVYFLSDRGGTVNIWSLNPADGEPTQHTDLKEWDARWPGMGPDGRIAFIKAADIHVFDPSSGSVSKIDVELPSDRVLTRSRFPNAGRYVSWFDLTPDGDRLAVVARGEIFSVPVKDGVTLPVTRGTGAREFNATFGPKGERILYVTDEPREEEFRIVDAWGRGEPEVVKPASEGWYRAPQWSADGKWIAYADNTYRLYVMSAEGGRPIEVDRSTEWEIGNYNWSPDGRWLAYVKLLPGDYNSIFIYDTKDKKVHTVTGPYTNDYSPSWDPDGRYLYFASSRGTNPLLGHTDWNNIEAKNDMLYMVLLRKDVENPLAHLEGLPPDEEDKDKDKDEEKKEDEEEEEKIEPVEIDFDGLENRFVELPLPRDNYTGLGATKTHLFYVTIPLRGMAEQPGLFQEGGPTAQLMTFSLEKKEPELFVAGISGYSLASKGEKIAIMKKRGEFYVTGTGSPPGADMDESKVDLSDIVIDLDPREEWDQMYYEAWRQVREYYWDEDMAGMDWKQIRDQYATLLPRLTTREDLRDLIGQVFGEMNTSHNYVWGGDPGRQVSGVPTGLLGADLVRDGDAYRVDKIYRADPADRVRSPLDEPGVMVKEGEYILAVNRLPISGNQPYPAYLANLAGKEVLLTVNDKPSQDGAREVMVVPMGSERDLRYSHWVRENREYVSEKTDGKIGYIHIPDMWTPGLVEFNTWFYPQIKKEGMIVDVRWNGGGSVSQQILERFRRPILSYSRARGGRTGTYPYRTLNGPFVVLVNSGSGSDGDIFPQAVQLEKLAPIIGMRTWGGVVGISGLRPLVDGGIVTQSQTAWWDFQDGWTLENRGVIPDIEVVNLPQDLVQGTDAQLERGITEVMQLHASEPPREPDFGPIPQRTRKAYQDELK